MDPFGPLPIHRLESKGQAELLARLDDLRDLGFRRQLALPQLVVCGDQNSGKSSVFHAITGVPLPTSTGLCTRFATEVILRRSDEVSVSVKIRPGPDATPDHRHKLGIFSRSHNWLQDIPKLYSEARLIMGLISDGRYSLDVLQLEASGPTLPDLTVVDLPGLINRPGHHQRMEDVTLVQGLTEAYMRNPRSIVLAVVSAERNISQQIVLRMTKSCSPRTMAIITKPDHLEPGCSIEENYFARAKNQDTPLRLGWHVLVNNDSNEKRNRHFQRDDMENLFFTTTMPWKTLSQNCVGIQSLRSRLGKILLGQIESQLSDLSTELQQDLETSRLLLKKLGPDRKSDTAQRLYLTTIAERFQALTISATAGEYHDTYFRYHPQTSMRRLRSVIRNWAEDFATDMEERGHSYNLYDDTTSDGPPPMPESASPDSPQPVPRSSFIRGLAELFKQNGGRETKGLVNSQVVCELFIRYSLKWTPMAKSHVYELWKKVKRFLDDLLHHIAGATVGEAILREILEQEMSNKLQALNSKIDELATPFKQVVPSTLNRKLAAKIHRLRAISGPNGMDDNLEDGADINVYSEILDCMETYYSAALPVFIDNVAFLAVENCLVENLENLLSPSMMAQLSTEQIERIAADSDDTKLARKQLADKVKVLELAVNSCRRCEMAGLQSSAQNYREPSRNNLNDYLTADTPDPPLDESPTPDISPPETVNHSKIEDSSRTEESIALSRSSNESRRSVSELSQTEATSPSLMSPSLMDTISTRAKSPTRTESSSGGSRKGSLLKSGFRKRILKNKPAGSITEDKSRTSTSTPDSERKPDTSSLHSSKSKSRPRYNYGTMYQCSYYHYSM
ncbi:dynamin family protein [Histoplasma capsulatum var. duboisii H88]|uniref:Dynamin family protein n=1 Tax=Ajellomyces capsulatus (strain H88) TaxID=544711 RepID=A0A8A1LL32_AJEC8|nr:dynamin family protein [Histoplasma capsulatum var. duboisii H88]